MNDKAVLAHGAASSADFVRRAFAQPLAAVGVDLVTWDRRTPVAEAAAEFAALVERSDATIVGGVSVGAILATNFALTAAGVGLRGLLVAMPPPIPGSQGSPRLHDEDAESARWDVDALIEQVVRDAVPWVGAEIRRAWPEYDAAQLRRELVTAASAMPPSYGALAQCTVTTGVVALGDDPVHPVEVAEQWARHLPHAALETLRLEAPADDVSVIGAAAVSAWKRASNAVSGSR
ncbi:MAG: alpha/beta hydrolase [Actinomycetes bacterium]